MRTDDEWAPFVVTSPANPRVKWLQGLRKRRNRDAEHLTVVEGYDELSLALDAGVRPTTLAFCPELVRGQDRHAVVNRSRAVGAEILSLGGTAFAKASYRESPDGWLAVVPDPARRLDDLGSLPVFGLQQPPLLLVCEAVEKPGNLGAMLRTAEAAGVHAVVAASPVSDWGNPNVVRASKGTVFSVPVAAAPAAEVAAWLHSRSVQVVVATPDADRPATEVDLRGPTAIVVGAEHEGVSGGWLGAPTRGDRPATAVRIPMFGQVNSLNVATSAAIVIYEALRQRAVE